MADRIKEGAMAKVSITKATYADPGIETLIEPLGGMERFVKKGEKVLLKVNLLSAGEPGKAVTTHPEFVKAVARSVKTSGGIPFIGDSPAGTFSERVLGKAYRRTGLEVLGGEEDISLNLDTGARKLDIPDGKRLKRSPICDFVL